MNVSCIRIACTEARVLHPHPAYRPFWKHYFLNLGLSKKAGYASTAVNTVSLTGLSILLYNKIFNTTVTNFYILFTGNKTDRLVALPATWFSSQYWFTPTAEIRIWIGWPRRDSLCFSKIAGASRHTVALGLYASASQSVWEIRVYFPLSLKLANVLFADNQTYRLVAFLELRATCCSHPCGFAPPKEQWSRARWSRKNSQYCPSIAGALNHTGADLHADPSQSVYFPKVPRHMALCFVHVSIALLLFELPENLQSMFLYL
jgi:hypothetical protein